MMPTAIERTALVAEVGRALARSPVVTLVGPRQCGKSTLARVLTHMRQTHFFDLENPVDVARLSSPQTTLSPLRGLVVLDEAQLRPDLFPLLRDAFDVLWAEGTTAPAMMSVGLHPRISGHPARAAGVARFLDHVAARGGVWMCRREEIAAHWMLHHPADR